MTKKKLTKERIFLSSKKNSRREESTPNGLGQNGQRDSKLAMVDDGRTKGTGDWIEFSSGFPLESVRLGELREWSNGWPKSRLRETSRFEKRSITKENGR